MNSQKQGHPPGSALPSAPEPPGLLLRAVARVLLSRWVLARVHRHEVRFALASLAVQVGRPEVAALLQPAAVQQPAATLQPAEPKAPRKKKFFRG